MRRRLREADRQMQAIYQRYVSLAKLAGTKIMEYAEFKDTIDMDIALELADKINPQEQPEPRTYYYAARRKDGSPHVPSVDGACDNCGHAVTIDIRMARHAFQAKAIHCNVCVPLLTGGHTIEQIANDRLKQLRLGQKIDTNYPGVENER